MFEACLILGLIFIVVAFMLAVVRSAKRPQRRNYIPKNKRQNAKTRANLDISDFGMPWEINYDAFNLPEFSSFGGCGAKTQNAIQSSGERRDHAQAIDIVAASGAAAPQRSKAQENRQNADTVLSLDPDASVTAFENGAVQNIAAGMPGDRDPSETGAVCEIVADDADACEAPCTDADARSAAPSLPPMMLASLLEIQDLQEQERARQEKARSKPQPPARPRMLGDAACELGIRYFDSILAQRFMPRATQALTNNTNIIIAKNALKASHPSAIFSHGAVAQRIGQNAVCLFEPLQTPIVNLGKALAQIDGILSGKTIFVVLSDLDACDPENLAHIGPICKRYGVAKTNICIEQPDKSFINYIENARDYVPSRIDVGRMPASFFSEIFDYAQDAFDNGDFEAVLRTVEPLIRPLLTRMRQKSNFPPILVAQALNLIGMTQREIGCDDRAVNAFEASLAILQQIEDYNAIKSVKANLGIALALSTPVSQAKIEHAIRHLNEVTQLNPRDAEAWLFLANSYIEQFKFTNAKSLLGRALRAYEKSYEIEPAEDVALCMRELERQMGVKPRVLSDRRNFAPGRQSAMPNGD